MSTITRSEVADPATDALVKAVSAREDWRWISDPAEPEPPARQCRSGSGSTWHDSLIRALALAKLHGTW
jgi:hypothetical protein